MEEEVTMRRVSWIVGINAGRLLGSCGKSSDSPGRDAKDVVAVADAGCADGEWLAPGSGEAQGRQREYVQETGLPFEAKTARSGIVLRLVPPGRFTMGSPESEEEGMGSRECGFWRWDDERPEHEVEITRGLYVG